ncbi:MAG: prepilin-type N-terminal cleavage/methylation domain-containing protein [Oscillospiraceae bacterium]
MKKNLKGFTLIELIIVMAIFTILLAMISTMFKPIDTLLKDAREFDANSTVAEGVNHYVGENLKFATNVLIFSNYGNIPTSFDDDADTSTIEVETYKAFMTGAGLNPTDAADKKKVQTIALINNETGTTFAPDNWNGDKYFGRVYRKRGCDGEYYEALGKPYYGKYSYEFSPFGKQMDYSVTPNKPLFSTNATQLALTTLISDSTVADRTTGGTGFEPNKLASVDHKTSFVNKGNGGKYYVFNDGVTGSGLTDGGTSGNNIYILYTLPEN